MEVDAVSPELAQELELPRGQGGAVITRVERNSPASNAGLAPNDVILEVNRQPVTSVAQVTRELQRVALGRHRVPARVARRQPGVRADDQAVELTAPARSDPRDRTGCRAFPDRCCPGLHLRSPRSADGPRPGVRPPSTLHAPCRPTRFEGRSTAAVRHLRLLTAFGAASDDASRLAVRAGIRDDVRPP